MTNGCTALSSSRSGRLSMWIYVNNCTFTTQPTNQPAQPRRTTRRNKWIWMAPPQKMPCLLKVELHDQLFNRQRPPNYGRPTTHSKGKVGRSTHRIKAWVYYFRIWGSHNVMLLQWELQSPFEVFSIYISQEWFTLSSWKISFHLIEMTTKCTL